MTDPRYRPIAPPKRAVPSPPPEETTLAQQHGVPPNVDALWSSSGDTLILTHVSQSERQALQERYPRNRLHFVDRREDIQTFMQSHQHRDLYLFADERLPHAGGVVMESIGRNLPGARERVEHLYDLRRAQFAAGIRPTEPAGPPSGVASAPTAPTGWEASVTEGATPPPTQPRAGAKTAAPTTPPSGESVWDTITRSFPRF
jgi:hypothetical protein